MNYAYIVNNSKTRTLTEKSSIPWSNGTRLVSKLQAGETGPDGEKILPEEIVKPDLNAGEAYDTPVSAEVNGKWVITYPVKDAATVAAVAQAAELARVSDIYERLRPEALELLATLSEIAVDYGINIDPATVTFTDLYEQLWGTIPPGKYERLRVIYENEVVAYEYEGNGKTARQDLPTLLYLAQQELQG